MLSVSNCTSAPVAPHCAFRAEPIKIQWDPSLPIFAKAEFSARLVTSTVGWGVWMNLERCAVSCHTRSLRKAGLRMVRFRVETIHLRRRP